MKAINLFLTEKLHLTKDNTNNLGIDDNWWYGEMKDVEHMPKTHYKNRKSPRKGKGGAERNRPWYAVVVYLSYNPDATMAEIKNALWPGKTGQQAELFTALRQNHIITTGGKTKNLEPFYEWGSRNSWSYSAC